MKFYIFSVTLVTLGFLLVGNVQAAAFDYKNKEFNLVDPVTFYSWDQNDTKLTFDISDPNQNDPTLYVWIENMTCSILQGDGLSPNYLIFESGVKTVQLPKWRFCDNVTASTMVVSSMFNNGSNVGLNQITVTPVGEWSAKKNQATLRFEIQRKKQFTIGDEMNQLDFKMNSKSNLNSYEIKLDQKSDFCKPPSKASSKPSKEHDSSSEEEKDDEHDSVPIKWNCTLSMAVKSMSCNASSNLTVTTTGNDGKENVTSLCENFISSNNGSKGVFKSGYKQAIVFQSLDKIVVKSYGLEVEAVLSVGPQLASTSASDTDIPSCPVGYFNCLSKKYCHASRFLNGGSVSCIPNELTCDGKPNCPSTCPYADEDKSFCTAYDDSSNDEDDEYFYCGDYWYYSGGVSIWKSFFAFLFFVTAFVTIGLVLRAIYARHFAAVTSHRRTPPRPQPYTTPTISDEVMKARNAPPPSYGEVVGNANYP